MAVTALSDVFVPEVIGQVATDILFTKVPLLRDGYISDAEGGIYNEGGNTVTFPYFNTDIDVVQDNPGATRSGVTPTKVSMGSYEEPVRSKIISIDMEKYALTDASRRANLPQHVAGVVATQSAVTIQRQLVLSAHDTDLQLSLLGETDKTLSVDSILEAKMKRGEYADEGMPILYASSKQLTDLAKSSDFKTLASANTPAIVNGMNPPQGALGVVHGCWVKSMDSIRNTASLPAISEITRASAVATLTTATAHGRIVGDLIEISGATQTEYNGVHVVASVPTATTLTFAVAGSPASPATGSPVFVANYTALLVWPDSLGLHIRKEIEGVLKDVHAGTTVVTTDWDFRYATTLFRNRPRGTVKLITR